MSYRAAHNLESAKEIGKEAIQDSVRALDNKATGAIELRTVDNCYGIPAWAQKDIFKKFFQADSIMSQKGGGIRLPV